jgi:hypothetical protein
MYLMKPSDFSDSNSLNPLLPFEKTGFSLLDSTHCFFTSALYPGSIQLYEHAKFSRIYAHAAAGPIEAHPLPHRPFTVNDDDRLHVFTIEYD